MADEKEFIEADVRETVESFSKGSVLSRDAEASYQGFLSSPFGKVIFQAFLLLMALAAYTFGPLLVSWSTILHVPDSARFITVVAPDWYTAVQSVRWQNDWYGVALGYQPGDSILFVERVLDGHLAAIKGVLPGDVVSRAWQGNVQIWPPNSEDDISDSEELRELKCVLERLPGTNSSCVFRKINMLQPMSVDFDMAHVKVSKSKPPYFPLSTTCVKILIGAFLLSLISGAQNKDNLKAIFHSTTVRLFIIPGLGWGLGEVCEVLASSNINPALYSVLSQSRILATAVFMRLLLGTKQTTLQSLILVSVSIVIFCYAQVPDYVAAGKYWNGFGDPVDPVESGAEPQQVQSGANIGVMFAFGKIFLAVVMGVVGQKAMADPHIKKMDVITMQASIFVVQILAMFPITFLLMWAMEWEHGFFGGVTVEFRHCVKDWPERMCLSRTPVALVEQGWDYRTLIVALFYTWRDLATNAVLKVFDALIRNMINATATLVTYIFSISMLGTRFNITKCGLIVGIMLQFVQYAITPKYVEPPPPPSDIELKNARSST